jgi:Fe2+ transport system protein FeoA
MAVKTDENLRRPAAVEPGTGLFCNLVNLWRRTREEEREALARRFGPPDETGHMEMPLSCMLPGDDGHVLGLRGDPEVRQHLPEMGFTVGTPVVFVRVAPLGDPLTVCVRGYQLSLRGKQAEAIWMRRCPPEATVEQRSRRRPTGKPA